VELNVRRLHPDDLQGHARWDEFVATCPDATFFHRAGWQRVLQQAFRHETHFLYAESAGHIEGVLPLARVKSLLFGHSLVSLPFAVYGGVAAASARAVEGLEREAQSIARRLGVAHLEFRHIERRHPDWPFQDLYVTFRKPMLASEEANLLAIPRKQRAMVRKGIANGLRSEIDPDASRLFPLYADNMHRHGTPALSRRYFEMLLREFGSDAEVMTIVSAAGRPTSSVLTFYFRDEVLPYYAGDDLSARDLAANDFKYWELLRRSLSRGARLFDFGRSKRGTGSFSFKKNWGFEPQPLHYEYRLYSRDSVPQNNPLNAKYRLLIEAWRRMPIGVANRLGPYVVRGLG